MAKIISNTYLGEDMYLMKVEGKFEGDMGQFYMLRAWDNYPLLSRPISIHDIDENSISFLYKVVGEGTKILSCLRQGENLTINGPYGNTFPKVEGKIALVGGGMGVAPLYLASKMLKNVDVYMGFREKALLKEEFAKTSQTVNIAIGNLVTDLIDMSKYDYVLTCGPIKMMQKVVDMAKGTDTKVYVSVENKMACGVGACLVCTCKTKDGNKRTCKDGPIFLGEEVDFNEYNEH